ncbi:T6SS immunity protein Tli4 family protein [Buttiauxella massiliensis]|uniref:T6SS immunity protein Tli4 family protein n=1 Tax=Buttiauxella massiliensis TaxID=2831590 RepID=UPI001D031AC2|nr:T6SS immunity protein Tli4 family protein [Buttiauxella massiliensis]
MSILLQNMKTRCVGRYLVDFPEAYMPSEKSIITVNDSEITTKRMYAPAFEQSIHLRERELVSKKTISSIDMPYLKNIYKLPDGLNGVIFERVEQETYDDVFRVLEAHLYSNGVAIKIELAAKNGLDKRYDDYRKSSPKNYENNVPNKLAELNDLLVRIQGRAEDEIPMKPGNCIQNAFILDNNKDRESIDMLYESNNTSQLRFGISTNNFIQEKDSLLERSGGIVSNLLSVNGSLLRQGVRNINGLFTEELLAKGKYSEKNDNDRYDFIMLTNEKTGSYKTPVFSLELLNEEWIPSPYNQDEIVSFWDAISQTLRVRPGAF